MAGRATPLAIPRRLRTLQSLDRHLGPVLLRLSRPAAGERGGPRGMPLQPGEVRRVLVIRPGGLGDAVLMWPMLTALREGFPAATLHVLAERRNAAALGIGNPGFEVFCYDRDTVSVLRRLRGAAYDLVIDTEQYHHISVLLANWLRPRWLCGFDRLGRGRFQTHPVPYDEDRYEAVSFLQLAEAVTGQGLAFDPDRPFLAPAAADVEWAERALAGGGRPVAVVMPAAGGSYRLWSAARYADVAALLAARGFRVAVLGGPDGAEAGRIIHGRLGEESVCDLTGRTTLAQTAAVLSRAALALCADTGVLHLAYAVGVPTVSLFGPGLHRKWGPPGRRHRVVRLGLPCSPCTRNGRVPHCPIDVACMRDLDVPRVTAAIDDLLAGGASAP